MRRVVIVLVLAALSLPLLSQEVAVFVDHRSLIVQTHKVDGDWTYFRIGNGEMAVLSNTILKITKEGALPAAQVIPPSPAQPAGPGWRAESPAGRPQMAPPRPPTPAFDETAADDESDTEAEEPDDEDSEKPVVPPHPNMPNRPGMPPNMMPMTPGTMPVPAGMQPGTGITSTTNPGTNRPFTTTPENH